MRNILSVLLTLCVTVVFAQKQIKIKGNKDVTEVFNNLPAFKQIEVANGLQVSIMQTGLEGYRLNTDANLIDVIKFEVTDSVLKLYTTQKIVAYKKLEIQLTTAELKSIVLVDKSSIESNNQLQSTALSIASYNDSKFNLDVATTNLYINMKESSNGKLLFRGDNLVMDLNNNAKIRANISATNLESTINERANINIEGNTEYLNLMATGSSDIKARNLIATDANINGSNNSDVYVYASKTLTLYAKGKSNIYVYGNPKINVEGLSDRSQIIKK